MKADELTARGMENEPLDPAGRAGAVAAKLCWSVSRYKTHGDAPWKAREIMRFAPPLGCCGATARMCRTLHRRTCVCTAKYITNDCEKEFFISRWRARSLNGIFDWIFIFCNWTPTKEGRVERTFRTQNTRQLFFLQSFYPSVIEWTSFEKKEKPKEKKNKQNKQKICCNSIALCTWTQAFTIHKRGWKFKISITNFLF